MDAGAIKHFPPAGGIDPGRDLVVYRNGWLGSWISDARVWSDFLWTRFRSHVERYWADDSFPKRSFQRVDPSTPRGETRI